jgi:hypothetical protein
MAFALHRQQRINRGVETPAFTSSSLQRKTFSLLNRSQQEPHLISSHPSTRQACLHLPTADYSTSSYPTNGSYWTQSIWRRPSCLSACLVPLLVYELTFLARAVVELTLNQQVTRMQTLIPSRPARSTTRPISNTTSGAMCIMVEEMLQVGARSARMRKESGSFTSLSPTRRNKDIGALSFSASNMNGGRSEGI